MCIYTYIYLGVYVLYRLTYNICTYVIENTEELQSYSLVYKFERLPSSSMSLGLTRGRSDFMGTCTSLPLSSNPILNVELSTIEP